MRVVFAQLKADYNVVIGDWPEKTSSRTKTKTKTIAERRERRSRNRINGSEKFFDPNKFWCVASGQCVRPWSMMDAVASHQFWHLHSMCVILCECGQPIMCVHLADGAPEN